MATTTAGRAGRPLPMASALGECERPTARRQRSAQADAAPAFAGANETANAAATANNNNHHKRQSEGNSNSNHHEQDATSASCRPKLLVSASRQTSGGAGGAAATRRGVTQSETGGRLGSLAAAAAPARRLAAGSIKRPLLQEEERLRRRAAVARSQQQVAPGAQLHARAPLKQVNRELAADWRKSSTPTNAGCKFKAAPAPSAHCLRLASGERCCELPHHKTAAHHLSARHFSATKSGGGASLASGKRAASSLSLVGAARRPAGALATPAHKGELAASAQVTNSRLRQGALFARRQLHLLQAPAAPAPLVALAPRGQQQQAAAGAPLDKPQQQQQQAARARQLGGQVTTAAEARRRATRQVVLIPAGARVESIVSAGELGELGGSLEEEAKRLAAAAATQNAQVVQKKASQLSSSSSSLSLDAFVVKRPRQQQNSSSSASSSCASISSSSRRWSTSSGSPAPAQNAALLGPSSASCVQLAGGPLASRTALDSGFGRGHKTPPPPASDDVEIEFDGAEQLDARASATDAQRPARTSLQTAFAGHQNNGAQLPKPESVPGQFDDDDDDQDNRFVDCDLKTGRPASSQLKLLDAEPVITRRGLPNTIRIISESDKPTTTTGNGCGAEHAFSATTKTNHGQSRDTRAPAAGLSKQAHGTTTKNQCHLDVELEPSADLVAIGCAPIGFVVAAPTAQLLNEHDDDCQPDKRNQLGRKGSRPPQVGRIESSKSCNRNNHANQVSHQPSPGGNNSPSNVDMMISLGPSGDARTSDGVKIPSTHCIHPSISENTNNNNNNDDDNNNTSQQQVGPVGENNESANNKGPALAQAPLDLSKNKTQQVISIMPQESIHQTKPPITLKNQPLGLHQSSNIAAASPRAGEMVAPTTCRVKTSGADEQQPQHDQCCALDLTLGQSEQRPTTDGFSDSALQQQQQQQPPPTQLAQPAGQQEDSNVIARQKLAAASAEIPIRTEPICDHYDLETRPFARGKFAQVKRCTRKSSNASMKTGECYAAKCIKKRRRLVDIKHEILLEIEALKLSFETRHIVRLYEVYETPNEMILILEMANGGELQRVLDDEEQIAEPLVRKMIDQILEGLIYLHDSDIAHLDIKPQNLLLSKPFPDGDIKLCDFGISRRITRDCEIREICGTPDYVAPEILRYDPISLATDMWSLGVLTYVLLTGYSPFGSENKQQTFCNITQATLDFPPDIFGKISDEAVDFMRKLIVREPLGRLTSRQAKNHHWISNHKL